MNINNDIRITDIKVLTTEEVGELVSKLAKEKKAYKDLCQEVIDNMNDCGMENTAEYFQERFEKIGE